MNSEPSPSSFSRPLFQSINSQILNESSPAPSSYTDTTPIPSPMSTDQPDPPSPITDKQLEHELDNFITLQHHLHNTHTLTLHNIRIFKTSECQQMSQKQEPIDFLTQTSKSTTPSPNRPSPVIPTILP